MEKLTLILMGAFVLKHFLADFWAQTDRQVIGKGIYGNVWGFVHSGIHAFLTWCILMDMTEMLILTVTVVSLFEMMIHYHIDWAKSKLNKFLCLNPSDHDFWFLLGLDQLLHYSTYIGIIYLVTINFKI